MRKNHYFYNIALLFISFLICFVALEIIFRIILFSNISQIKNIPILAKQLNPGRYANPYSEDDYWKLAYYLNIEIIQQSERIHGPFKIDSFLGWSPGYIDPETYLHDKTNNIGSRRPVLLYGDSFAKAVGQDPFEYTLNSDEDFSKDYYLLNYGENGYGADQIFLLIQKSVDNYKNPFVVICIMPEDLDRSILTIRDRPKPYFLIKEELLRLNELPVGTALSVFFSENPVQITSYAYRRILFSGFAQKYLPARLISFLKKEDYFRERKIKINEKIIHQTIKELRDRDIDFVFLIFHSRYNPWTTTQDIIDWRDSFLMNLLENNNVPYIWSRRILNKDAKDNKKLTMDDYYLKDAHPNSYTNRLVAEAIKTRIINSKKK